MGIIVSNLKDLGWIALYKAKKQKALLVKLPLPRDKLTISEKKKKEKKKNMEKEKNSKRQAHGFGLPYGTEAKSRQILQNYYSSAP